jgi:hypothetical protein
VNKLIQALLLVIIGLAVLASASRPLARLTGALVPLVLIVGVVVAALRIVWAVTRHW